MFVNVLYVTSMCYVLCVSNSRLAMLLYALYLQVQYVYIHECIKAFMTNDDDDDEEEEEEEGEDERMWELWLLQCFDYCKKNLSHQSVKPHLSCI